MIHPCPKPERTEKPVKRSSLTRSSWLKSTTPIKKENPVRQGKRRKLTAAFHRTRVFIAAGEEAMKRARGRCEFVSSGPFAKFMTPGRCEATEGLERHCKSYPKTRPIMAKDITILCDPHHQFVEMTEHPTRKRR